MEKEIDSEVIKLTQISLGKYVKRPPLTEKLLKKPPFRFLHDVITTVLKTTGFFGNLFEEEELISENVKDRDSKILFLNKVIYVLSSTTGKSISAKPSKIVAGQEVDKTNELLQCLAQALDDKLSSDKAVQQYNLKSTQATEPKTKESSKPIKKGIDTKKLSSKSSEKLTHQKNDGARITIKQDKEKSNDSKSKRRENGTTRSEVQTKKPQQSKSVVKKNAKEQKEPQRDDTTQARDKSSTSNIIEKEKSNNSVEKDNKTITLNKLHSKDYDVSIEKEDLYEKSNLIQVEPVLKQDDPGKLNSSYTIDLNSSASSNDLVETSHVNTVENNLLESSDIREISLGNMEHQNQNHDHNEVTLKSLEIDVNNAEKPVDTNKDPENKIVDSVKHDTQNGIKVPATLANDMKVPRPSSVRPVSVRPSSSRPGAPRMREKVDNVIKDTDKLLMGKVNIIVENTHQEEEEDASLIIMDQAEATAASQGQQELQLSSSDHGHLVQQILNSQKELSQISGKTEIEWQFGAQKARQAMNQDVEQLRFNIQALSRVANPLGKLLDHVQEDVEVMRQELQQWSNIYEEVNKEMLKQKTINEDSLMPFHTKLKHLEGDIEEKHDKINDLKILIHKNAIRIEKLLSSGNVQ